MKNFEELRDRAVNQFEKELEEAFHLGQSEEVLALKRELEETLQYAQEAYDLMWVVESRLCINRHENILEHTTKSYLEKAREKLESIKGIKR